MTKDKLLELAEKARCTVSDIPGVGKLIVYKEEYVTNLLARFAKLVEAETIERCAKECRDYAESELSEEMRRINEDDWSAFPEIDDDSDDESLNESHPRTVAENTAKATAWMMMQCGHRIMAIEAEKQTYVPKP